MKYCHECGAQIEDTDKFCIVCGALQEKVSKRKQYNILGVVAFLISLIVVVGAALFFVFFKKQDEYNMKSNYMENVTETNEEKGDYYINDTIEEDNDDTIIKNDGHDMGSNKNPIKMNDSFEIEIISNYIEYQDSNEKPRKARLRIAPIEISSKAMKCRIEILECEVGYVCLDLFSCEINGSSGIGFYNISDFTKAISSEYTGGYVGDTVEGYMIFYDQLDSGEDLDKLVFNYVAYDDNYSRLSDVPNDDKKFTRVYFDLSDYESSISYNKDDYYDDEVIINYAEASSQLDSAYGNDYYPYNLIDDDPGTAWVEGVQGTGIGESITIHLDGMHEVNGLAICNGYTKNWDLYFKNGRVREVSVDFGEGIVITQGIDYILEYDDTSDVDIVDDNTTYIDLDKSVITDEIKITIIDAFAGNKYADTCISGIEIY